MMRTPGRFPAVVLTAVAAVILIGAGMAAPACAGDAVSYRLKWVVNMSTVGEAYAQAEGLFQAAGLDVTLKPGGPETDAIRELELGHADFGVVSADQVIRALAKGADVVVLAQLFQNNPLNWIYRPDRTTIKGLPDLAGKTIGVTFGKNDEIIMRTLLSRGGIDPGRVHLFSVRLDYTPFYRGRVDLWPVYINSQGVEIAHRMAAAGEKTAFFDPSEYGVRFVANSVITAKRTLAQRPELVRCFVDVLLSAWRRSLDPANEAAALAAVRRFDRDTSDADLKAQLESTRRLVIPRNGSLVGTIDRRAWRQTEEIMLSGRQIDGPVNVTNYLWREQPGQPEQAGGS